MKTHVLREPPSYNEHPSYKGGYTVLHGGYVYEFAPDHPRRNMWGWVAQHRLIGEEIAGRPLVQHSDPRIRECVHHRDENRLNNDPSNLQVMTFSAHRRHHMKKRNEEYHEPRRPTRQQVQDALAGRSILDAATHLGVVHQSLRNWYPDILAPRKRKSPVRMDAPTEDEIEIVRRYAADPDAGLRECKAEAHMSYRTIGRLCEKLGIEWVKKTKKGEMKKTYRGRPTPKFLAASGCLIEPVSQ